MKRKFPKFARQPFCRRSQPNKLLRHARKISLITTLLASFPGSFFSDFSTSGGWSLMKPFSMNIDEGWRSPHWGEDFCPVSCDCSSLGIDATLCSFATTDKQTMWNAEDRQHDRDKWLEKNVTDLRKKTKDLLNTIQTRRELGCPILPS